MNGLPPATSARRAASFMGKGPNLSLGLHAFPWLYRSRDDSEHPVRKNISSSWKHAKARRITLLELPLEVFEFVQQLPPRDGNEKLVRLTSDLQSVETVSSLIRFLVNTPKIRRNPGSRPLQLSEALQLRVEAVAFGAS